MLVRWFRSQRWRMPFIGRLEVTPRHAVNSICHQLRWRAPLPGKGIFDLDDVGENLLKIVTSLYDIAHVNMKVRLGFNTILHPTLPVWMAFNIRNLSFLLTVVARISVPLRSSHGICGTSCSPKEQYPKAYDGVRPLLSSSLPWLSACSPTSFSMAWSSLYFRSC